MAKKAKKTAAKKKTAKKTKPVARKASPATQRARRAAKTAATEKVARIRKPAPRNQDLPGMEDRAIKPLEEIAIAYAAIRDQRIALNVEEKSLKDSARRLMHKYNKTVYKHDGVEIRLVPGEEDVKVKVRAADDGDAGEAPAEPEGRGDAGEGGDADQGDQGDAGGDTEDSGGAGDDLA